MISSTSNHVDHNDKASQIKAFKILFLAVFIDMLGFTLLMPLIPFWTLTIGADEFAFGALIAVYSLFQFIFSPIWGRMSDRIGRRPIILLGLTGTFLSFMLLLSTSLFFFNSIPLLFTARIFGGIFTSATLPTSQAYISDVIPEEDQRTTYFGYIGAAMGIAFTIGPAIGGILSGVAEMIIPYNNGYWFPILVATILTFINLFYGLRRLPESLSERTREIKIKSSSVSTMIILKKNPRLIFVMIIFSGVYLTFSSLDTVLALFGKERFGMNELMTGIIFLNAGILIILVQGLLIGKLTKKYSNLTLVMAGTFFLSLGYFGISTMDSIIVALFWTAPIAIGMSLVEPAGLTMLTKLSPEENKGQIMGINDSVGAFMRIIGPLLAISLYSIDIVIPWYANAGILIGLTVLSLLLFFKTRTSTSTQVIKMNEDSVPF